MATMTDCRPLPPLKEALGGERELFILLGCPTTCVAAGSRRRVAQEVQCCSLRRSLGWDLDSFVSLFIHLDHVRVSGTVLSSDVSTSSRDTIRIASTSHFTPASRPPHGAVGRTGRVNETGPRGSPWQSSLQSLSGLQSGAAELCGVRPLWQEPLAAWGPASPERDH